jgi:hypothetical protein
VLGMWGVWCESVSFIFNVLLNIKINIYLNNNVFGKGVEREGVEREGVERKRREGKKTYLSLFFSELASSCFPFLFLLALP